MRIVRIREKCSTAAACFVLSSDRRFEAFVDVGGLTGFAVGCTLLEEVRSLCAHLSSMPHYVVVSAAYALLQVVTRSEPSICQSTDGFISGL